MKRPPDGKRTKLVGKHVLRVQCEHENAEHMMPGESSTPDWFVQVYAEFEQFRCIDCGEWLSLGPSNEASDAVQIDIRAAELAACLFDAKERLRSNRTDTCGCFEAPQRLTATGECQARWLADIIHDREPVWDEPAGEP